jgi:hypothetical protein
VSNCRACHHDRDRHGPEAGGCIECRCSDTFVRRVPLSTFSAADLLGLNDDEPEEYGHDCEHTSLQHGADGCNVPGCLCAFMSWNEDDYR